LSFQFYDITSQRFDKLSNGSLRSYSIKFSHKNARDTSIERVSVDKKGTYKRESAEKKRNKQKRKKELLNLIHVV
jgi:hypothetical protein